MIHVLKVEKENGEKLPTRIRPFNVGGFPELEQRRKGFEIKYKCKILFTFKTKENAKSTSNRQFG